MRATLKGLDITIVEPLLTIPLRVQVVAPLRAPSSTSPSVQLLALVVTLVKLIQELHSKSLGLRY